MKRIHHILAAGRGHSRWPARRPTHSSSTDEITTVVVTGSHIANQEEGALPVQVITQAQIERDGRDIR